DAGGVPGVDLVRGGAGEADRAAIGAGRALAVDRLGQREIAARGHVEDAAVGGEIAGVEADRAEHRVIELLGLVDVVRTDHDMAEHGLILLFLALRRYHGRAPARLIARAS